MNIEYTKQLSSKEADKSNNWIDLQIALKEREDNLLLESPTVEQKRLIHKLKYEPRLLGSTCQEIKLLSEMAVHIRKMWKANQELKVFFLGGQDYRTDKVLSIASEWSNYCSIKLLLTSNKKEADLRISFDEKTGSWSYIGTDAKDVPKNEATINFGWLNPATDSKEYKRVILHEFGHALGLIHEHQNPAIKINWNKEYIYNTLKLSHGWDEEKVNKNIIDEFEATNIRSSEIDIHSIMAYAIPKEFTIEQREFKVNYELSEMDKQFISQVYQ
jgi:hypothetical protein